MALAMPPGSMPMAPGAPGLPPIPDGLPGPYRAGPSVEELRFHPRARAEAMQAARRLDDGHLAALVREQKRESLTATSTLREQADEAWRYYQGDVDWSDKETWQSQVWVPLPWTAVEQATTVIQRALLDSPEFFGLEGFDQRDKALAAKLWKPVLKIALAKAGFIGKFADATKVAFATGISGYLKVRYPLTSVPTLAGVVPNPFDGSMMPQYQVRQRGFLQIDVIPPTQIFRDPRSKPRQQWSGGYLIHEEEVDRPAVYQAAETRAYRNLDTLKPVAGGYTGDGTQGASPEAQARRAGLLATRSDFRKPFVEQEWWGDVLSEDGDIVLPDARMLIVNDTAVYGPVDNPLWAVDAQTGRRKWPFVGFTALTHPYRFEGWGILQAVSPLAALFSNLFNLFVDGLNWEVNPPTEVDLTVLSDWDDLEHIPGKLWIKQGAGEALRPAQMGRMNIPAILGSLQFVDQMFQNESFVTSFVQGLPGYRSNITARETQIKTTQSMGVFDGMARNLESGAAAVVELVYDHLHQYMTEWTDPSIVDLVGPGPAALLATMPYPLRLKELRANFNYLVTGISSALQKADQLGRLLQLAQIAASGPYQGRTDPSQVLGAIVDTLGIRDKVDVATVPMIPLPQVQQMLAQMLSRATGQPVVPRGGGLPPEIGAGGPPTPQPTQAELAAQPNSQEAVGVS